MSEKLDKLRASLEKETGKRKDPRKHPTGGHRQTAHLGAGNAAEGYSSHQQPLR